MSSNKNLYRILEIICVVLLLGFIVFLFLSSAGGTQKRVKEIAAPVTQAADISKMSKKTAADAAKVFGFDTEKEEGILYYANDNIMDVSELLIVKVKDEAEIEEKEALIEETKVKLEELEEILNQKKAELVVIVADTEKEEEELLAQAEVLKSKVDQRLLTAFERIRKSAHNGLAIVKIERDACGGCFSKIPPQRQLDIALHKKIIVCEACGRIFIDDKLVHRQEQ